MGKYRPSKRFTKKRNSGMFISIDDFNSYEKEFILDWMSNIGGRIRIKESGRETPTLEMQFRIKYRTQNNYKLLWMYEV